MPSGVISPRVWKHYDFGEQSRVCRICRVEKPIQQFEKTSPYRGRVYRRHLCRECRKPSLKVLEKRWNESHRERRLEIWRNSNMRRHLKAKGMPEKKFHEVIEREFENAYPLFKLHPDYYHSGKFIEVKRAATKKEFSWLGKSSHFPNLFFKNGRKSLADQIVLYPKPLLVIIFDKETGVEICRKEFDQNV